MQPGDAPTPDNQAPVEDNQSDTGTSTVAEPASQWTFNPEAGASTSDLPAPSIQPVSWTASEYVEHEKSLGWFMALGLAIAVLTIVVYLFTRDFISPAMIIIIGVAFGVFAARPPQVLDYRLDEKGLHIGQKFYPYDKFKSFSVIQEGALSSIFLLPLQRFMPPLSIYYDPADEDKIAEVLGSYLPHEDRSHDFVDKLMRKIRF